VFINTGHLGLLSWNKGLLVSNLGASLGILISSLGELDNCNVGHRSSLGLRPLRVGVCG